MIKKLRMYEVARYETWEGRVEIEASSIEEALAIAEKMENDDFRDDNMETSHEVIA